MKYGFSFTHLLILCLLLGSIMMIGHIAYSLYHQANRNKLIMQMSNLKDSISVFQYKYQQLPGDFPVAHLLWPGSTQNGNGNQQIDSLPYHEPLLAWQHLYLAGMQHFPYQGLTNTPALFSHIPASHIHNGGFVLSSGCMSPPCLDATNTSLLFAALWGTQIQGAILSPQEAHAIDHKLDDGLPLSGQLKADKGIGHKTACSDQQQYNNSALVSCRLYLSLDTISASTPTN